MDTTGKQNHSLKHNNNPQTTVSNSSTTPSSPPPNKQRTKYPNITDTHPYPPITSNQANPQITAPSSSPSPLNQPPPHNSNPPSISISSPPSPFPPIRKGRPPTRPYLPCKMSNILILILILINRVTTYSALKTLYNGVFAQTGIGILFLFFWECRAKLVIPYSSIG